jgi:hypothetical protein
MTKNTTLRRRPQYLQYLPKRYQGFKVGRRPKHKNVFGMLRWECYRKSITLQGWVRALASGGPPF